MSSKNGDKSRFHRQRKQKIQRRMRNQELLSAAGTRSKNEPASPRRLALPREPKPRKPNLAEQR